MPRTRGLSSAGMTGAAFNPDWKPTMNKRLALIPLLLLTFASLAADTPDIPAEAIAKKKELLFSDDFERADLGDKWKEVVPTFTLEDGALKGTQTRVNTPAADGKPAIVGHQAVIGTEVPTKDSVVEFRFKFSGATAVSAEFDDRKYTGSTTATSAMSRSAQERHPRSTNATAIMRNDIYEMKDPAQKAEAPNSCRAAAPPSPSSSKPDKWYTLVRRNRRRRRCGSRSTANRRLPQIVGHRPPHQVEDRARRRR